MTAARLGNDMYGEDPTANELEVVAARLLGKESAVLMPSGVMANQIALSVLAGPDQLVAVGSLSHIHVFEGDLPQRRLMPLDDTDDGRFIELVWSALPSNRAATNTVMWSPPDAGSVVARLADRGVLVLPWGDTFIRAVTHPGVSEQSMDRVVEEIASL